MPNYSYLYSGPYILVLFLFLFLSYYEQKTNKKTARNLKYFSVILYFWFFAFRGFVASDWTSYYDFFDYLSPLYSFDFNDSASSMFEPGFVLFSSLLKSISDNFHVYVFFNTLLTVTLLIKVLQRYCSSFFVFALTVFFVFAGEIQINLLRNFISILLFLLSIEYLQNRKFIPFLLLNLIGITFHYTAIFFIPLYFFIHKQSKVVFLSVFLIGCIVYFFQVRYIAYVALFVGELLGGIFSTKAEGYLESSTSGITMAFFYLLIPFILILKNYDNIVLKNKYNVIFINMFLLYCFANLFFTEILAFRSRFAALFVFSLCILIPQIIYEYKDRQTRLLINSLIIIIMLFSKVILTNYPILNKYDNLTFGIRSYDDRIADFNYFVDGFKE